MANETYVIAVKREARERAPGDWVEQLRAVEGVEVTGASRYRAQFRATPEALEEVRRRLGGCCRVEPVMRRERSS